MSRKKSRPTIKDVAELAEVSSATVSYVLSGRSNGRKARVSDETKERVLAAASKLGYVPNQAARSLRQKKTKRICMVVPRLGVPYYDLLASDVQASADAHGYTMLVAVLDSEDRKVALIEQLRQQMVDGVIFNLSRFSPDKSELNLIAETGVTVVVFSRDMEPDQFDVVRMEEREAIQQAVDHLIPRGHRRIALVGGNNNQIHSYRLEIYRQLLEEQDVDIITHLIPGVARTRIDGYYAMKSLLQLTHRPTAVVTMADLTALGAHQAARNAGLDIPEDIAIIGMGNVPDSEIVSPPLTTLGPREENFSIATTLLFDRILGKVSGKGRLETFSWHLIPRGSA